MSNETTRPRPPFCKLLGGATTTAAGERLFISIDAELSDWIRKQAKKAGLRPGEWVRAQIRVQKKASEDPR